MKARTYEDPARVKTGRKTFTATVTAARYYGEPTRTGTVELTIDVDALIDRVGGSALWNKTHRASFAAGAVKAVAHSITEAK